MSTPYVIVSPAKIGWRRINAEVWTDRQGKRISVNPNNPVVHVPTDYPDLQR